MIQDNKKIPKKIKDILIQNPHWITNDLDLLNQIIDSENKKQKLITMKSFKTLYLSLIFNLKSVLHINFFQGCFIIIIKFNIG